MQKTLVTYTSRFGSTAGIAEKIAQQLMRDGAQADVRMISEVTNLNGYSGVIVGGPIFYDRWSSEAIEFVEANKKALKNVPHAFFFSCLNLSRKTDKSQRQVDAYADAIQTLSPRADLPKVGQFAGKLNYQKIPRFSRPLARILFAFLKVKEGDHRNWGQVES